MELRRSENKFDSMLTSNERPREKSKDRADVLLKMPSRVIIDRVLPTVESGQFSPKRYIDEEIEIQAWLLVDGHETAKGRIFYRHEDETNSQMIPLKPGGNDVWSGRFQPQRLGRYQVIIEAAIDRFSTWRSDTLKKLAAGQRIDVDLQVGLELVESWRELVNSDLAEKLTIKSEQMRTYALKAKSGSAIEGGSSIESEELRVWLDDPELRQIAELIFDPKSHVRYQNVISIQVECRLARFSTWYELFPRSVSSEPGRHGTFRDVERRLGYIEDMGFDVLYLPPIHPIGHSFRKGKNNALNSQSSDVGSPWAIGSHLGGHKDILPELGTNEDFRSLINAAAKRGISVAMDLAFQCSPDHPYVREHPEWFKKRPDGSIQYAENPPKKYQDIYPFDFETPNWRELWQELKSVVEHWIEQGIRVFRVDNPHTKPLHFWEWLISEIKKSNPDVIFLAEAFTRPKVMAYLAKIGFTQSYTYFSWRNTKWELTQYAQELTKTDLIDYFLPNFWPNTPDILPPHLQSGHRPTYIQRLILAATLSSSYGIYGPAFELMESVPREEGIEEYRNSEKYQLRDWDLNRADSIAPVIKLVNQIRRENFCLQSNRSLEFHDVNNESLIAYSKVFEDNRILVVVNLDPYHTQSGTVEIPLKAWGIDPNETFQVQDLLTGSRYFWSGWRNYVELNPWTLPAHIFLVRRKLPSVNEFEYFT